MLIALPCNCHLTDANSYLILQRSKAARLQLPYKVMYRSCRIYHKGEWTCLLLGRNAVAVAKVIPGNGIRWKKGECDILNFLIYMCVYFSQGAS